MLRQFLIALQFLTRLPIPKSIIANEDEIGKATAFFPLVGVIVGGCCALVFAGLNVYLPASTSVIGVLVVSVLLTGAFHEDGLADSFDGFGGGWTKEDVLRIMRDSRIGTYGGLSLILLVLAKYNLLSHLAGPHLWRWLIFAHAASRWTVLPLCMWLPYARPQGQGGLVARRIGWPVIIGTATVFAVGFLLPVRESITAASVTIVIVLVNGLYYRRRLDGITGDALGATNQLTEVVIYLTALFLMRTNLVA